MGTGQHAGEGTPPHVEIHLPWEGTRTGWGGEPRRGLCARQGQPQEAQLLVLCPPGPSDASRSTLCGFLNWALNT